MEKANAADRCAASILLGNGHSEPCNAQGRYVVTCLEKEGGKVLWVAEIDNVVTTQGKNLALDTYLAGAAYTVTGPYMGLISSTSFTAVSAADTMASHAGWLEAGSANAPTYTAPRGTCVWAVAASGTKALASPLTFAITGSGSVIGAFITFGTGAVNTIGSTAGSLYSAGAFANGTQTVSNGNLLNVQYSTSL